MEQEYKKALRRDSNINALLLAGFWIIYLAVEVFLPGIVSRFIPDTDSSLYKNTVTLCFYILLYPIGFPLLFLLFRIVSRKYKDMKILACFRKPRQSGLWVCKWIILTIGATYAAAYLSEFIFYILELITGKELSAADMSTDNTALGIITTLISAPVFAPIFEELFFRGTLYRNVRKYGTWSMIIVCGITFGLWHANYPQFLFASAMGIFSCFLYAKTKSIIPSMIVHFIINSIGAFTLVMIGQLGLETKDDLAAMNYSELMQHPFILIVFCMMGMGIICFLVTWLVLLIIEIAYHKDSFRLEREPDSQEEMNNVKISEGRAFITYITAPAMLAIMLFMLGFTVFRALGGQL